MTRETNSQRGLESYSAIASYTAAIFVALVLAGLFIHGHIRSKAYRSESQIPIKGEILAGIKGVDFGTAPQTLILVLNVDCGFCARSIPFYKRLLEAEKQSGHKTQIIALFPNQDWEVRDYIARNQLIVRALHEVDYSKLGVGGTPAILLADQNGSVLGSWLGLLSIKDENEVLQALKSE